MIKSVFRAPILAVTIVLALLGSLLTAAMPAQASQFNGASLWWTKVAPGKTLSVTYSNWNITSPTFQWYRCDTPVESVQVTSTPIQVPADCEAIVGETGNQYTISSLVAGNPDEGKYLTAMITAETAEYSLAASTQNFIIINRYGGNTKTDGMRIVMGNGSVQIYRNSYNQIFDSGYNGPASSMPALGAEGKLIVPADPNNTLNGAAIGWNYAEGTELTPWDEAVTSFVTDDDNGLFVATTVFSKTFPNGNHYSMTQKLTYRFPNQVADISFSVEVPAGATTPVSLYYGIDMYLDGNDFGPGKSLVMGSNRLVVQSNQTGVGGILEGNGPGFTSWVEAYYYCIFGFSLTDPQYGDLCGPYGPAKYAAGTPEYPNTIDPNNTDSGVGAQWALGSSAGTYERNMKLYFSENKVQVSLNYSQDVARVNSPIVTYLNVLNTAGSLVDNMAFDVAVPDATYGNPVSTCGGTVAVDHSSGASHVVLTGGHMSETTGSCQIIIPTTFTAVGDYTVNASDLAAGYFYKDHDVENATSISNMLGTSITVTADGPVAPANNLVSTSTDATGIGQTTAVLTGTGSLEGLPGYATFCYSTHSDLSNCTEVAADQSLTAGDPTTDLTASVSGLQAGTKYYYRVTVSNGLTSTSGSILNFTTANCYEELTGGNIQAGDHVIKFTGDCQWTVPAGVTEVKALVVAGGGGGGADCVGGGGGAGGLMYNQSFEVEGSITVTVGQGGAGGQFQGGCQGTQPGNGGSSSFGSIHVDGGGAGGNYNSHLDGTTGGSGGGGGGVTGHGASNSGSQGHAGGDGAANLGNPGGGGGGAGSAGGNASPDGTGGLGGAGFSSDISGETVIYAAGGGGGSDAVGGAGGADCAGVGASGETPATDATGYGCGGGGGDGHNPGGVGSAGVVIIRWSDPVTPPANETATKSVTGFSFEKATLTSATKHAISSFLNAHSGLTKITCTGYTGYNWFHRSSSFLKKLALQRATLVCNYAKSLNSNLTVVKKAYAKSSSKKNSARKVVIKLTN